MNIVQFKGHVAGRISGIRRRQRARERAHNSYPLLVLHTELDVQEERKRLRFASSLVLVLNALGQDRRIP